MAYLEPKGEGDRSLPRKAAACGTREADITGWAYASLLIVLVTSREPAGPGKDIGRELFRLVVKAREAGRDSEMELRAAARRYRDPVRSWENA